MKREHEHLSLGVDVHLKKADSLARVHLRNSKRRGTGSFGYLVRVLKPLGCHLDHLVVSTAVITLSLVASVYFAQGIYSTPCSTRTVACPVIDVLARQRAQAFIGIASGGNPRGTPSRGLGLARTEASFGGG